MARLLDDIRRWGKFAMPRGIPPYMRHAWDEHCKRIYSYMQDPIPLVVIDNVSEYYYTASDQEHWDIARDFPNLAPPFDMWWMEHRFPKLIHSKERGDSRMDDLPHGRFGILFIAVRAEDAKGEGIPANAKWILLAEQYFDWGFRDGEVEGPQGTWMFCIDENGALIDRPWMQTEIKDRDALVVLQASLGWIHPSLLAVSFMHCKNVSTVENATPPKLAKKYAERNGGLKPTTYKTLVIEPLKEILRKEGKSDQHGIAKAMHICRGHFRDYRQGKGLFGKYQQLVWTPATVRGTQRGEKMPAREIEVRI